AASFQAAVVGQLVAKVERALDRGDWPALLLGGGVAANSALRRRAEELCAKRGMRLKLLPPAACTDNAAVTAAAARHTPPLRYPDYLDLEVTSGQSLDTLGT